MKTKKVVAVFLSAVMGVVALSGCGGKTEKTAENIDFKGYPINSETELSYWVECNANVAAVTEDLNKTPFAAGLKERTGVNVKFIHPPQGQDAENLNLILASNEVPDIIEYPWASFPGGPTAAINDGYIMDLTDVIDKYAPNLKKYLSEHPDIDKMIKTGDGKYYCFPFVKEDEKLRSVLGLIIRQDWLDDLNLEMPETMDDWHNVLTQFKEKKGAESPLSVGVVGLINDGAFIGAYGITKQFTVDDGKVVYGPYDPRYKEFLTVFAQWYKEGLIDKNTANIDSAALDSNIINGKTGASYGYAGSGLGKWLPPLREKDSKANLMPAPNVALAKGQMPILSRKDFPVTGKGAAISTSCKNVELAARLLDYAYSEEGELYYNFGTEGESYNMVDGYPTYTDKILHNTEGWSTGAAMAQYIRGNQEGPFRQRVEYIEQYYELPQQAKALEVWSVSDAEKHLLPPILGFTDEENSEVNEILNNIQTYVDEKTILYITGLEDLSTYDQYLKDLKSFGVERMIEIYQAAYDRYLDMK